MNEKLIEIFKKVINGSASVKSDIIDYIVENGGPGPAMGGDMGGDEAPYFNKDVTIELNGAYNLDSTVYCAIACLIAKNKKILAIKALRAETALGLKECKAAVYSLKNWNIVDAPNN
jgi:hypothetical protein